MVCGQGIRVLGHERALGFSQTDRVAGQNWFRVGDVVWAMVVEDGATGGEIVTLQVAKERVTKERESPLVHWMMAPCQRQDLWRQRNQPSQLQLIGIVKSARRDVENPGPARGDAGSDLAAELGGPEPLGGDVGVGTDLQIDDR